MSANLVWGSPAQSPGLYSLIIAKLFAIGTFSQEPELNISSISVYSVTCPGFTLLIHLMSGSEKETYT